MSQPQSEGVTLQQARAFLTRYWGAEPAASELLGAGAWSRCFGFRWEAEELVIRFGNHVADFHKDQRAYRYATPALPIPKVLDIGPAFAGYYAISSRVHGVPLESVSAAQWSTLLPAVVDALEALRLADLAATEHFGGWGLTGQGSHESWASYLLAVGDDTPDRRTHGWRQRLAAVPQGEAAFRWGFERLKQVAGVAAPRCLLHCDLTNRNVLVQPDRLTGVLDWGCSLYGDHLYDLAWFEFWAPWTPNLDVPALRSALEKRWQAVGYVPAEQTARLAACYLHIGLDHLAYNAYTGNQAALLATAEQMRTLVSNNGVELL